MILNLIELLKLSDFYGQSELIDIAKGQNEYDLSIKKTYKREKRKLLSKVYKDGN